MYQSNKELFWIIVTAIAVVLLINLCSCAVVPERIREKTWPLELAIFGSVEPFPNASKYKTTKTNAEWDVERRNIYSDGFEDGLNAAQETE